MSETLIGLIPAAGKGTRLNLPYPKELYPIIRENHYKPLAQFVVENLLRAGVKDIVFIINETKHQLIGYFASGRRFGCNFTYAIQEDFPENGVSKMPAASPGLAQALNSGYHLTRGKTVLFGMADTIMRPESVFSHLLDSAHSDDQVVLGLFPTDRPEKLGMVAIDDTGSVLRIDDKPKQTDLTFAWGCIMWRPKFTEFLCQSVSQQHIGDFARIMNDAIKGGFRFRAAIIPEGQYADLGTYEEIQELERKFHEWD